MNLKLFIAKRYLFSKKTQNVINIISLISIFGVAIGTAALIVVLSVFNGFDGLIQHLFNAFDPNLKITLKEGKTFNAESAKFSKIKNLENIVYFTEVLEENVLLKYGKKIHPATLKGVSESYKNSSGLDTMIIQGSYLLEKNNINYAIVGQGIAYYLSIGLNFINPIVVFVPKRGKKIPLHAQNAFNRKVLYPSGIYSIQQDFDSKYVITSLHFVRELLNYKNEVSAIELKVKSSANINSVKKNIKSILGEQYNVKDQNEQHELFYKIMKSEKWAIFLILSFILLIASFNIIGSITMLIIDKKNDIFTINSLGANKKTIRHIFLIEGWFISIIGAVAGLLTGGIICWLQITYKIVKLQGSGSFIIDAYPVALKMSDFVFVLLTVLFIGYIAAWLPSRYVLNNFMNKK
ncbi:MAG: ABC transporter permease [Chlorobi bacterium]|nr:ABC transporter permease [Chlorobiota bacterium]